MSSAAACAHRTDKHTITCRDRGLIAAPKTAHKSHCIHSRSGAACCHSVSRRPSCQTHRAYPYSADRRSDRTKLDYAGAACTHHRHSGCNFKHLTDPRPLQRTRVGVVLLRCCTAHHGTCPIAATASSPLCPNLIAYPFHQCRNPCLPSANTAHARAQSYPVPDRDTHCTQPAKEHLQNHANRRPVRKACNS